LTQGFPGLPNMGALTVCYDENAALPSFDLATNTLNLVDNFGTNFNLELLSISDANGCMESLTGQEISITLGNSPPINTIPPITACAENGNPAEIDLSQYITAIGGANPVIFYSDPGLTNEIGPIFNTISSTTIYAVVSIAGCTSMEIEIDIIIQVG